MHALASICRAYNIRVIRASGAKSISKEAYMRAVVKHFFFEETWETRAEMVHGALKGGSGIVGDPRLGVAAVSLMEQNDQEDFKDVFDDIDTELLDEAVAIEPEEPDPEESGGRGRGRGRGRGLHLGGRGSGRGGRGRGSRRGRCRQAHPDGGPCPEAFPDQEVAGVPNDEAPGDGDGVAPDLGDEVCGLGAPGDVGGSVVSPAVELLDAGCGPASLEVGPLVSGDSVGQPEAGRPALGGEGHGDGLVSGKPFLKKVLQQKVKSYKHGPQQNFTPECIKALVPGRSKIPGVFIVWRRTTKTWEARYAGALPVESCSKVWDGSLHKLTELEALMRCLDWMWAQHGNSSLAHDPLVSNLRPTREEVKHTLCQLHQEWEHREAVAAAAVAAAAAPAAPSAAVHAEDRASEAEAVPEAVAVTTETGAPRAEAEAAVASAAAAAVPAAAVAAGARARTRSPRSRAAAEAAAPTADKTAHAAASTSVLPAMPRPPAQARVVTCQAKADPTVLHNTAHWEIRAEWDVAPTSPPPCLSSSASSSKHGASGTASTRMPEHLRLQALSVDAPLRAFCSPECSAEIEQGEAKRRRRSKK